MTDCYFVLCWLVVNAVIVAVALKCIIQLRYVMEAFSLYHALTLKRTISEPYSGAGYVSSILLGYTVTHAIVDAMHTHESCIMHNACM